MSTLPAVPLLVLVAAITVPGIVAGTAMAFMFAILVTAELVNAARRTAIRLYAMAFVAMAGPWVSE
jgi:hypothetical protein